MEVCIATREFYVDGVASAGEIFGMQWLVDIGDEVEKQTEGEMRGGSPVWGLGIERSV